MKLLVLFLCFCLASPVISEEINLSLDFELNEPENVIFNSLRDIATDSDNNIYVLDNKEKVLYLLVLFHIVWVRRFNHTIKTC